MNHGAADAPVFPGGVRDAGEARALFAGWAVGRGRGSEMRWRLGLVQPEPSTMNPEGGEARLFFGADARELFGSRDLANDPRCFRWALEPGTNPDTRATLTRLALPQPEAFTFMSGLPIGARLSRGSRCRAGCCRWR